MGGETNVNPEIGIRVEGGKVENREYLYGVKESGSAECLVRKSDD